MTDLEMLIHYYEVLVEVSAYRLEPGALSQVKQTIKFLKELKELKGE